MATHFRMELVEAADWSSLNGLAGNQPRPHLIPTTSEGEQLVAVDAASFTGRAGLCPDRCTVDGQLTLAYQILGGYRSSQAIDLLISQLNRAVTAMLSDQDAYREAFATADVD